MMGWYCVELFYRCFVTVFLTCVFIIISSSSSIFTCEHVKFPLLFAGHNKGFSDSEVLCIENTHRFVVVPFLTFMALMA